MRDRYERKHRFTSPLHPDCVLNKPAKEMPTNLYHAMTFPADEQCDDATCPCQGAPAASLSEPRDGK